jgi:hypothetical protein
MFVKINLVVPRYIVIRFVCKIERVIGCGIPFIFTYLKRYVRSEVLNTDIPRDK